MYFKDALIGHFENKILTLFLKFDDEVQQAVIAAGVVSTKLANLTF